MGSGPPQEELFFVLKHTEIHQETDPRSWKQVESSSVCIFFFLQLFSVIAPRKTKMLAHVRFKSHKLYRSVPPRHLRLCD